MDLRVKRTIKNINNAFFELRKKKDLDKISVRELSELAMINKATFYLHYRDIYELSDKLEEELIRKIISEVKPIKLLNTKENFRHFTQDLTLSILNNEKEIKILFSGYGNNLFINRFETSLKKYIFSAYPNIRNNIANNILISFIVHGSFNAYIHNENIDKTTLLNSTVDLTLKLVGEYTF